MRLVDITRIRTRCRLNVGKAKPGRRAISGRRWRFRHRAGPPATVCRVRMLQWDFRKCISMVVRISCLGRIRIVVSGGGVTRQAITATRTPPTTIVIQSRHEWKNDATQSGFSDSTRDVVNKSSSRSPRRPRSAVRSWAFRHQQRIQTRYEDATFAFWWFAHASSQRHRLLRSNTNRAIMGHTKHRTGPLKRPQTNAV